MDCLPGTAKICERYGERYGARRCPIPLESLILIYDNALPFFIEEFRAQLLKADRSLLLEPDSNANIYCLPVANSLGSFRHSRSRRAWNFTSASD